MNRVHIIGRKNHGKTALLVELVQAFVRRGVRVGVIKHSKHSHELDTPGKDSHRLRSAGASPAAVASADLLAVFLPRRPEEDFYSRLAPIFADCQLVLVEGHADAQGLKIEVWRKVLGGSCLANQRRDICAVVSDDQPDVNVPIWPRSDVELVADNVMALVHVRPT